MRRVDFENTHGYRGKVKINGQEKTKYFSDKKHGGKRAAKAAAAKWQEQNSIQKSNTGFRGIVKITRRKKTESALLHCKPIGAWMANVFMLSVLLMLIHITVSCLSY